MAGETRRSFPSASGVYLRAGLKYLEREDQIGWRNSAIRATLLPDQPPFYQRKSVLRKKLTAVGAQILAVVAQMEVVVSTLPGFALKSPGRRLER